MQLSICVAPSCLRAGRRHISTHSYLFTIIQFYVYWFYACNIDSFDVAGSARCSLVAHRSSSLTQLKSTMILVITPGVAPRHIIFYVLIVMTSNYFVLPSRRYCCLRYNNEILWYLLSRKFLFHTHIIFVYYSPQHTFFLFTKLISL